MVFDGLVAKWRIDQVVANQRLNHCPKSVWLTKMTMVSTPYRFHTVSIPFPDRLPQRQHNRVELHIAARCSSPVAKFEVCQDLSPCPQVMLGGTDQMTRSTLKSRCHVIGWLHWHGPFAVAMSRSRAASLASCSYRKCDGALQKLWKEQLISLHWWLAGEDTKIIPNLLSIRKLALQFVGSHLSVTSHKL